MSRAFVPILVLLAWAQAADVARAQMFAYEPNRTRSVSTLSVGYHLIDFSYNGSGAPATRFDFDDPVYALRFTRQSIDLMLAYGWRSASGDDPGARFAEASFLGWSGFLLTPGSTTRLYLPLALHSSYRAVGETLRGNTASDLFNFTTLGLGSGLVLERRFADAVNLQARVLPVLALALRSFEGFAGDSRMLDLDAQVELLRLFGNYGLTLGYGFRGQGWDVDAGQFTQAVPEDWFDYKSRMHMLRVGVNW